MADPAKVPIKATDMHQGKTVLIANRSEANADRFSYINIVASNAMCGHSDCYLWQKGKA